MQDRSFQQRIGRIETLVGELEGICDPAANAAVKELVASVLELNAAGFGRVVEVAARYGEVGSRLIDGLIRDEAVSCLLILYGLHPHDFETRVRGALRSFEGVKLLSIEDGRVRLRIDENGRAESTVRESVHAAAPDLTELTIECAVPAGFVPLTALTGEPARTRP